MRKSDYPKGDALLLVPVVIELDEFVDAVSFVTKEPAYPFRVDLFSFRDSKKLLDHCVFDASREYHDVFVASVCRDNVLCNQSNRGKKPWRLDLSHHGYDEGPANSLGM